MYAILVNFTSCHKFIVKTIICTRQFGIALLEPIKLLISFHQHVISKTCILSISEGLPLSQIDELVQIGPNTYRKHIVVRVHNNNLQMQRHVYCTYHNIMTK